MKKLLVLLLGLLLLTSLITGCSEKDDDSTGPDGPESSAPELATIPDLEFQIPADLTPFTSEDVDYNGTTETGYALPQFISMSEVNEFVGLDDEDGDARNLFAIQEISSDEDGNWTPRSMGVGDLTWQQFETGFLLPNNSHRTFFPDEAIVGTFNCKYATFLNLFRKIDLELAGNIVTYELGAFTPASVTYTDDDGELNTFDAISLSNIITDYTTEGEELENYNFEFIAVDGWVNNDSGNIFTWEVIQNSIWIPEKEKAVFLNADNEEIFKSVKKVQKVRVFEN